ncbi:hypothetical protein KEJ45_03485 [Candidatus Bathyarchaeota archaeon]|nr:hypothetical protein [Candidatus Bathyarchaeota archaeon]
MAKIKVYVYSFSVPTVGFVDRDGAVHACAHAQKTAFEGLERISNIFGNRYLSDEDGEALERLKKFCSNNGLEFEVVDVGAMNFANKLRLRIKGVQIPSIEYRNKIFKGIPSEENLKKILENKQNTKNHN